MSDASSLRPIVFAALERRRALVDDPALDAFRVVNGESDGAPGLVIERLGPALIVQLHEGRLSASPERLRPAIEALHQTLGTRAVYIKQFVRDRNQSDAQREQAHHDATPWIGMPTPPELAIHEGELKYLVRPYDGFSVGLFLDQRDNRARVRDASSGRRVLNLFAYTCGFSVAAAAGGAIQASSVDLAKKSLEWGKANFAANGLDPAGFLFYASDVLEFYARAARQGRRYDLIVLDPPTFSRTRRPARVFVLEEQLPSLLAGSIALLDPGGVLLVSTNCRALDHRRLETAVAEAAAGRRHRVTARPGLPIDFAGDPHYAKSMWIEFS